MSRRTKEELKAANYYVWLEVCKKLRAKKKNGFKLSKDEKTLLKTMPTPESPYEAQRDVTGEEQKSAVRARIQKAAKVKIDFDKNVVWPVRGNSFLCAVYNIPYQDEQCLIFCPREDCPFYRVGYFRSHGLRF